MENRKSSTSIQIRLTPQLKERFDNLTDAQGINKSLLVRQLIEQYCNETESSPAPPQPLRQLYTKTDK